MDHAAAKDLDPAAALAESAALAVAFEAAHVHLGAGLREGEMMGAELHPGICAEEFSGKFLQSPFQIGKGNILVNNQTLNLMEGGRMGRIHLVGAEDSSRCNHTDWELSLLHHACLHW